MNTHTAHTAPHQHGLSLVELMVALVIGLILTAGVISVYITSKKSYSTDTGIAQVQENGRFVLGFMEPVIRMAGFQGCVVPSAFPPTSIISSGSGNPIYDYSLSLPGAGDPTSATVVGYDANGTDVNDSVTLAASQPLASAGSGASDWSPNVDSTLYDAIKDYALTNSDILMVHAASSATVPIVDNPLGSGTYSQASGIDVATSDVADFNVGELAIVSDCGKATLFQITGNSSGAGPLTYADTASPGNTAWIGDFNKGSQITAAQTYVYFIGLSKTDLSPALFQLTLITSGANAGTWDTPQELVPDIENMQILYGVDTDGDKIPNHFVSADTVNTNGYWGKVVSVRIALIARSDDHTVPVKPASAQQFNLDDVTVTVPLDQRLRKVFVQTIGLRNMLP